VTLATDWVTISALATAGGTLVLALATFASVRSANRAARTAERTLLAGLRPLLLPAKPGDPPQKIGFVDDHWFTAEGGQAVAEVAERVGSQLPEHRDPDEFIPLNIDLYIPVGDVGYWQGAFRDPESDEFAEARDAIERRMALIIDVLYGDHEGGQRTITRFAIRPRDGEKWSVISAHHWNIDRDDPR
jgi:hypothetical protein